MLERQPELEHYSEGVVFEDRLSPRLGLPAASCAGKEAYSRLCWSLRFHRTLFFSKAKVGGRADQLNVLVGVAWRSWLTDGGAGTGLAGMRG